MGWRSIFLINVPIGLFALGITRAHVTESRDPERARARPRTRARSTGPDRLSWERACFCSCSRCYEATDGWTSPAIVTELMAAAALLVVFVLVELRAVVCFFVSAISAQLGTGLFNPLISNVALSSLPKAHSGLAAGANDTFRQAGIAVGIAALGALIPAQAAIGDGDPHAYVSGLHHALIAGAGLAAAGAIGAAVLLGTRRGRVAAPQLASDPARVWPGEPTPAAVGVRRRDSDACERKQDPTS